jgi:hypothetical protein
MRDHRRTGRTRIRRRRGLRSDDGGDRDERRNGDGGEQGA